MNVLLLSTLLEACGMIFLAGVIFSLLSRMRLLQSRLLAAQMYQHALRRSLLRQQWYTLDMLESGSWSTAGENLKPDGL